MGMAAAEVEEGLQEGTIKANSITDRTSRLKIAKEKKAAWLKERAERLALESIVIGDLTGNCRGSTAQRIKKVMMKSRDKASMEYLDQFKAELQIQEDWMEAQRALVDEDEFLFFDTLKETVGINMLEWEKRHPYNAGWVDKLAEAERKRAEWMAAVTAIEPNQLERVAMVV